MMDNMIMVSVVCNAFNHEKYIGQALESFVNQQTDFSFEVLVHDDASTDGTADIIRTYAEKYPDIIKPYFQTENQYSKHIPITRKFQYSRARGKYIALCEGDDYWTDSLKLQKQVDGMEAHPELDICSHRTVTVTDGKEGKIFPQEQKNDVLTVEKVIDSGGGFVATNSLLFRRDFIDGQYDYTHLYNLDFIIQVSGSLRGGMLFLNDVMAAYRKMSSGSWTAKAVKNTAWMANHRKRIKDILNKIDADTNYVHSKIIQTSIARSILHQMAREGNIKKLFSAEGRTALRTQDLKRQVKIILFAFYMSVRK